MQYETTARTGDEGKDAKSDFLPEGGVARICATTQTRNWRAKAESDIDKVSTDRLHISRLRVCTNQAIADKVLGQVLAYAEKKLPTCQSITVHGRDGLTDSAFHRQSAVTDNYRHEIAEQTIWYKHHSAEDDGEVVLSLLRVALTTVFSPDVIQLREALVRSLICTVLSQSGDLTINALRAKVATSMKLADVPDQSYFLGALDALAAEGNVVLAGRSYRLTPSGRDYVAAMADEGTGNVLSGRASIQEALEAGGVAVLSSAQFSTLWRTVQHNVEELFLNNGLMVVGEVKALVDGSTVTVGTPLITKLVDRLIDKVNGLGLTSEQELEVVTSLQKLFVDPSSDAVKWLSELAVKYLVLASLGLDAPLQLELSKRIASWIVVPDTHVCLSWLCEGDEGFAPANTVLSQLRKLSAQIQMAEPVLDEILNHAFLASKKFNEFFQRLSEAVRLNPTIRPSEILEHDDNAFIKGFAFRATMPIKRADFAAYMGEFKNASIVDIKPLLSIFQDELGATFVQDSEQAIQAGDAFAHELLKGTADENSELWSQRCKWDGRLLAGTVLRARALSGSVRTIIVSGSSRIRRTAATQFGEEQAKSVMVVGLDALSFALASVPGTTVNLECVRHFLFGASRALRLEHAHRSLLENASVGTAKLLRRHGLKLGLDRALLGQ